MKNMQRLTKFHAASITCLALAAPLNVEAAVDVFLQLDGIEGESTSKDHKGHIDVLSWSFGLSRAVGGSAGTSRGASKLCASDISVMKFFDKSSPAIMTNMVSGKAIPKGKLMFVQAGEGQKEYLTIELTGILVSSYQASGSSETPVDSVSLHFGTAKVTYKPIDDKGGLGGAVISTFPGDGC